MASDVPSASSGDRVAVSAIRELVERTPGVALAVVFGSTARQATRKPRNLDIGVLTDPGAELPALLDVALERATRRVVDLVHMNTAPPLLRFEIARDGIVIFERKRYTWADFRRHAMIDWWDWAPFARRMHGAALARLRSSGSPVGTEG